jgi:hypothetical protein
LGALLGAATSCEKPPGPADVGFLDTPLVMISSDSGALHLDVFSNPQPPVRGVLSFRYRVTDGSGALVDGLALEVTPWMPSMDHGSPVTPTSTPRGAGLYDLTDVYLVMPGEWQLRTAITGETTDSAAPQFMVQ